MATHTNDTNLTVPASPAPLSNPTITYVCLLSNYTVASAQAIHHLRPGRVIAISSLLARDQGQERRFLRLLETWGIPLTVLGSVTGDDFPATRWGDSILWLTSHLCPLLDEERAIGRSLIANLTGSTKVGAMALKECWPHWHELHYTAEGSRNQIEVISNTSGFYHLPELGLLEDAGLLLDEVQQKPQTWSDEDRHGFLADAEYLYQDYLKGPEHSILARHHDLLSALWYETDQAEQLRWMEQFGLSRQGKQYLLPAGELQDFLARNWTVDPSLQREGDYLLLPANSKHPWVKFLGGLWLEHLATHWLSILSLPCEANLLISQPEARGIDSEADLLTRDKAGTLRLIECKVEPPRPSGFTDLAKKLSDLSQRFGKGRTSFLLGPGFWWHCKEGVKERFEEACTLRGIALLQTQEQFNTWLEVQQPTALPPYRVAPQGPAAQDLLDEAEQLLGAWSQEKKARLAELGKILQHYHPAKNEAWQSLENRNKLFSQLKNEAYDAGRYNNHELLKKLQKDVHDLNIRNGASQLEQQFRNARNITTRNRAERDRLREGEPLSKVQPRRNTATPTAPIVPSPSTQRRILPPPTGLFPNDLRALAPAPGWTLLLDETGANFGGAEAEGKPGKFVGLLVNTSTPGLAPLPLRWHATECDNDAEIDQVLQAVLDAPCGVLGLQISAIPETFSARWLDGMFTIIDWVLRLLPLAGSTRLNVLIEGRPPFPPQTEAMVAARRALTDLARIWPERAKHIDVTISTIAKAGHPLNGYVDALAYTWGSTTRSSKERRRRSGLVGTCLLQHDSQALRASWDTWNHPGGLPASDWAALVASPDAESPSSLVSTLLEAIKDQCRHDPDRWQRYLDETRRHLGSKRLDLTRLAKEFAWLEDCRPELVELPPVLRLIWITTRLALSNHTGEVELRWKSELQQLRKELLEEDARLVCHTDLHLAVCATNRFDFELAEKVLQRWEQYEPIVMGLQYWGQLRSSMGQHAAFRGDQTQALVLFDEAIATFRRLSDPLQRRRELSQTQCYRVIALMDQPQTSPEQVRQGFAEYLPTLGLPVDLLEAAEILAASTDPGHAYAHHVLLRYLVFRQDHEVADRYLAKHEAWSKGEGHPWPLITLYRGLLLVGSDPERAVECMLEASTLAFGSNQGPTVHMIGAVCRTLAAGLGRPWDNAATLFSDLQHALPAAKARLDLLEGWLSKPGSDPLDLLRNVLPFNFR